MKRKRGRPRRPLFPVPRDFAEGVDIATFGGVGASDLFAPLLLDWPRIGHGTAERIASFLQERGSSGFEELARIKAALDSPPEPNTRRMLAIQWRIISLAFGVPFNVRTLTEWFLHCEKDDTISASSVSKLVRWAETAKLE